MVQASECSQSLEKILQIELLDQVTRSTGKLNEYARLSIFTEIQ